VLKTLATSGAIVLSAVLGWVLFGAQLDIFVTIGCICTILAIFNYTVSERVFVLRGAGPVGRLLLVARAIRLNRPFLSIRVYSSTRRWHDRVARSRRPPPTFVPLPAPDPVFRSSSPFPPTPRPVHHSPWHPRRHDVSVCVVCLSRPRSLRSF